MITKFYADNRCVAECDESMTITQNGTYSPSQEDGYSSVKINTDQEIKKKPCNCPNCGAPINSYICEYCGTVLDKAEKKLTDEEMRESFGEFVRKQKLIDELKIRQRQAELQSSQEWQIQNLLNTLNVYGVNTQIMNMRDSIQAAMMDCQLSNFQTQLYQVNNNICQHIPINKFGDVEIIGKKEPDISISKADEEFVSTIFVFMIGMILCTIFAIVVIIMYNLC